jgi:hypothetical protein
MYKKTEKNKEINIFSDANSLLSDRSKRILEDEKSWYNSFRREILFRIDEGRFKVLYSEKMGAPNASVRVLVGMMVLKESFGWNDAELYRHCRFDITVRRALNIYALDEDVPVESTYYLFKNRIYEYEKESGINLIEEGFKGITSSQVREYQVDGHVIRMDSTMIGSNIANYSRYEIIHRTLCVFLKSLKEKDWEKFSEVDRVELEDMLSEDTEKTVYNSTSKDLKEKLIRLGVIIYKVIQIFSYKSSEKYKTLCRVFEEQYKIGGDGNGEIELKNKGEISAKSVQSPYDTECTYRKKGDKEVKGYSMNLTETISEDKLNLITDVQVEAVSTADVDYVEGAIRGSEDVTGQEVRRVYADGAYNSANNDKIEGVEVICTGIQGKESRYDIDISENGEIIVTDEKTGETYKAEKVKRNNRSKSEKWYIKTDKRKIYFDKRAIEVSMKRKLLKQMPKEELNKRNNVEATMFQLKFLLRNGKTRYRGKLKNVLWAYCRCLWINLRRIMLYSMKKIKESMKKAKDIVNNLTNSENTLNILTFYKKLQQEFSLVNFFVLFFLIF